MLKGVYLTLLIGPTIAVPVPPPVIHALKEVQVTVSAGQRSGFQLSFAVSRTSLLQQALIPAGYFDPGIRVIVIATVSGMPNVLMDGVITRQSVSMSNEPGQSTLTVTGEDLSLLMDLTELVLPYPATNVALRVSALIAKYAIYGMIPLVIPELLPNVVTPVQGIPYQRGTDLSYIQQLARENGYVFYVDPGPAPGVNVAYFGPEIRIGIPQPALNVNLDTHTNVDNLSFTYDGLSREQIVAYVHIPNTSFSIPVPIPEVSLLKPPLALRQASSLRTTTRGDINKLDPAQAAARLLADAAASSDAIKGSGSLDVLRYGRALKARQLVGVRGAGLAYDGLYYVRSVTHSLKPGEYKQNFELVRNGLISITPGVPA